MTLITNEAKSLNSSPHNLRCTAMKAICLGTLLRFSTCLLITAAINGITRVSLGQLMCQGKLFRSVGHWKR